jgi:hypothetical protein
MKQRQSDVEVRFDRRRRKSRIFWSMPAPQPDPPKHDPEKKLGGLAKPAQSSLADLLQSEQLKAEQWLMRLSVDGHARSWEPLTNDSARNNVMIKQRIDGSEKPVTELVLGFVGMVEWRGSKRLMAYLQYFDSDCVGGLLCLQPLREGLTEGNFETVGGFLIVGACKNIWI